MTLEETEQPKPHFDPTIKKRNKRRKRRRNTKGSKGGEKYPSILLPHQRRIITRPLNYPRANQKNESGNTPKHPHVRTHELPSINKLSKGLEQLPLGLVKNLYSALGGQPSRSTSTDRLFQLCSKALKQESRVDGRVKDLHHRDRQALAILLHCGGMTHHEFVLS